MEEIRSPAPDDNVCLTELCVAISGTGLVERVVPSSAILSFSKTLSCDKDKSNHLSLSRLYDYINFDH